ncbi:BrnT family toxin [Aquidulcibacter sp.]|uniref:BrnT family toxin n=1 Tax=Aquidulcibacter sp. TaxID=2052990 RepID=UPI0025C10826|nr:BrnT family toxin [Aquidulcibacter sp.]MCA3698025.1 BrnT family toxin [Aquidulcibacter sp.]
MEFEWDEEKSRANLIKHGVDFVDAVLIFENIVLSAEDRRHDYGERRMRSIGVVDDDCFVVVHTQRGGSTRLISAWKGGTDERELYRAHVSRRSAGKA